MKEILLLEKGDIINNGDLFFTVTGRGWQPVEKIDFGQKVESRFEQPVIRRVSKLRNAAASTNKQSTPLQDEDYHDICGDYGDR